LNKFYSWRNCIFDTDLNALIMSKLCDKRTLTAQDRQRRWGFRYDGPLTYGGPLVLEPHLDATIRRP